MEERDKKHSIWKLYIWATAILMLVYAVDWGVLYISDGIMGTASNYEDAKDLMFFSMIVLYYATFITRLKDK